MSDKDFPEKISPPTTKCTNSGFNFGISTKLKYDNDYTYDYVDQSTAPLNSLIDPNRAKNCNQ
jgi:hypothetical protein